MRKNHDIIDIADFDRLIHRKDIVLSPAPRKVSQKRRVGILSRCHKMLNGGLTWLRGLAPIRVLKMWVLFLRKPSSVLDAVVSGKFLFGLHSKAFYASCIAPILIVLPFLVVPPEVKWSEWWWSEFLSLRKPESLNREEKVRFLAPPDASTPAVKRWPMYHAFNELFNILDHEAKSPEEKARAVYLDDSIYREWRRPGSSNLSREIESQVHSDSAARMVSFLLAKQKPDTARSVELFSMREERYRKYTTDAWPFLMLGWLYGFAAVMWWFSRMPDKSYRKTLREVLLIQGSWFPVLIVILVLQRLFFSVPDTPIQRGFDYGVIGIELILACLLTYQAYWCFHYTDKMSAKRFIGASVLGSVLASIPIAFALQLIRLLCERQTPVA